MGFGESRYPSSTVFPFHFRVSSLKLNIRKNGYPDYSREPRNGELVILFAQPPMNLRASRPTTRPTTWKTGSNRISDELHTSHAVIQQVSMESLETHCSNDSAFFIELLLVRSRLASRKAAAGNLQDSTTGAPPPTNH